MRRAVVIASAGVLGLVLLRSAWHWHSAGSATAGQGPVAPGAAIHLAKGAGPVPTQQPPHILGIEVQSGMASDRGPIAQLAWRALNGDEADAEAALSQVFALAGMRTVTHGSVARPAVSPTLPIQLNDFELYPMVQDVRVRATGRGLMTLDFVGRTMQSIGFRFRPGRTPGQHLVDLLQSELQWAYAHPTAPQAATPLFIHALAESGDPGLGARLDAGTADPTQVYLSAAEVELLLAQFLRAQKDYPQPPLSAASQLPPTGTEWMPAGAASSMRRAALAGLVRLIPTARAQGAAAAGSASGQPPASSTGHITPGFCANVMDALGHSSGTAIAALDYGTGYPFGKAIDKIGEHLTGPEFKEAGGGVWIATLIGVLKAGLANLYKEEFTIDGPGHVHYTSPDADLDYNPEKVSYVARVMVKNLQLYQSRKDIWDRMKFFGFGALEDAVGKLSTFKLRWEPQLNGHAAPSPGNQYEIAPMGNYLRMSNVETGVGFTPPFTLTMAQETRPKGGDGGSELKLGTMWIIGRLDKSQPIDPSTFLKVMLPDGTPGAVLDVLVEWWKAINQEKLVKKVTVEWNQYFTPWAGFVRVTFERHQTEFSSDGQSVISVRQTADFNLPDSDNEQDTKQSVAKISATGSYSQQTDGTSTTTAYMPCRQDHKFERQTHDMKGDFEAAGALPDPSVSVSGLADGRYTINLAAGDLTGTLHEQEQDTTTGPCGKLGSGSGDAAVPASLGGFSISIDAVGKPDASTLDGQWTDQHLFEDGKASLTVEYHLRRRLGGVRRVNHP